MSLISNKIKEQYDNRARSSQYICSTGTITDYEPNTNTAAIQYVNPNDGYSTMIKGSVPVANNLGGLTGSAVQVGSRCSLTFINGNVNAPVITGIIDSTYQDKTSTDQGAYVVSSYINDVDTTIETTPLIETLLDNDNEDPYKYYTDYGNFVDVDLDQEMYDLLSNLDKYTNSEQGVTNLETKSNIRLKENGDIDIFVDNNTGIRISPDSNSIEIWGNVSINGKTMDFTKEG